jgi:hypothetical protein
MPGTTVDLRRELSALYSAGRRPSFVDVPELPFLMADGAGDPNTAPAYAEAVQALYTVAYTLRFALKRRPDGLDAPVLPLEGLWWADDLSVFLGGDRAAWRWTMLIRLPEQAGTGDVAGALDEVRRKKNLPGFDRVRLERFAEGRAAQVLHVGPYSAEGPTIERLHRFIADSGHGLAGRHHEIYLTDPRRTASEKPRTILRQPVDGA